MKASFLLTTASANVSDLGSVRLKCRRASRLWVAPDGPRIQQPHQCSPNRSAAAPLGNGKLATSYRTSDVLSNDCPSW